MRAERPKGRARTYYLSGLSVVTFAESMEKGGLINIARPCGQNEQAKKGNVYLFVFKLTLSLCRIVAFDLLLVGLTSSV